MIDLGTVRPGQTIRIPFSSFKGSDGSSITMTNFVVGDILVYKDGSTTERASTSGYTATTDFDAKTGKHVAVIDLADNTTAGFWAAGSEYLIAIDAVTVDAVTTGGWVARFRIGYDNAVVNTTIATLSSQTSFTLTAGPAEDDALNGCICYIHDVASAVQGGFAVVSDYTGSTKTVTLSAGVTFTAAATDNISFFPPANAIAANVTQLGGVTQSLTDLKDFADDGYDPSTNKVQGVVLVDTLTTYTGNTPQTGDTYALANGSSGFVATKADTAAILVDTNELQADWTNGGRLDLIVDAILDDTDLIDDGTSGLAKIATDVAAILVDTGTTLQGELDGIQADTEDIQARLPAALTADGNIKADALRVGGTLQTAGDIPALVTTVDTVVDAIKTKTDQFVFTVANQVDANALSGGGGLDAAGVRAAVGLVSANLDTQLADIPTVSEFNARTLVAADYFDPTVDTVAQVTLVSTTSTVTDGAKSATALSTATWTGALATNLATTNSTVATNLDATITSRMATWTPPSGFLAATFPSVVGDATAANQSTIAGYIDTEVAAIFSGLTSGIVVLHSDYNAAKTASQVGDAMALTSGERTTLAAAIWNALTSGMTTVGSIGKKLADVVFDWNTTAPDNTQGAAVITALGNGTVVLHEDYDAAKDAASQTSVNDMPTNAEFEARTLAAAAYGTAANQTTLLDRLTSSRAVYLDNLNVGGAVASNADILALNQSASRRILLTTVGQYERPESGSTVYTIEARTFDGDGAEVNADSNPTLTGTGHTTGSLAANIGTISNPATGVYRWTYTVASGATIEPIRFDVSATMESAFTLSVYTQVVDFVSATWTSADASKLTTLYDDWANGGRLDNILDARASQTSVDDLPTNSELTTALASADDATLAAIAALDFATPTDVTDAQTAIIDEIDANEAKIDAGNAVLAKLNSGLESDGAGGYQGTALFLENAPSSGGGGGGDATLAKQVEILDLLEADHYIRTSTTPWQLVLIKKDSGTLSTGTVLLSQDLKTEAGVNVTSIETFIGQQVG